MSPPKTTITTIKPIAAPTTDVTPEQALAALVGELNKAGIDGLLGKGARNNAMRIVAGRLHTAVSELTAARDHAAKLEAGMTGLVKEALAAIAGNAPLSNGKGKATPQVNGGDPASATTAPTV